MYKGVTPTIVDINSYIFRLCNRKIHTNTKSFYIFIYREVFELENIHNENKIVPEVVYTNNEKGDLNRVTSKQI